MRLALLAALTALFPSHPPWIGATRKAIRRYLIQQAIENKMLEIC